jgi:hypothetical protein
LPIAAQQFPLHLGQHVADLLEQPVHLLEPTRRLGTAARLAVALLPVVEAREQAGDVGNRGHGEGYGMWRDSQMPPPPMTIATIAGTISQITT